MNEELTEIKEEMYGYIDAVIQRQDRGNIMAKFETFTMVSDWQMTADRTRTDFKKKKKIKC